MMPTTPMTTAGARTAIVATLQAVPDIGRVHAWERYAARQEGLRALYVYSTPEGEQLRGWFVRRLANRRTRNGAGRVRVTTTWQLRGLMAVQDEAASELAFDALIDAIGSAFEADLTLGGTVESTLFEREVGAQLTASGPVMFAGVLCHMADITLTTEHME